MYTFRTRVRYSEIDANGHITLGSIINYLQDCTTFHSEDLGVGICYLDQHHRMWVLLSWQIIVEKAPEFAENITIGTQAYDFKGPTGCRNIFIMDEAGNYLVKANSVFCLVDTDTGKPIRVEPEFVECYGSAEPLEMDYASRKISIPKDGVKEEAFEVQIYHLDTNQHVNNEQYVQMAQRYLPMEFPIYQMRAEYRMQARLGDEIVPVIGRVENGYVVSLQDEQGKAFCVVEFLSRDKGKK